MSAAEGRGERSCASCTVSINADSLRFTGVSYQIAQVTGGPGRPSIARAASVPGEGSRCARVVDRRRAPKPQFLPLTRSRPAFLAPAICLLAGRELARECLAIEDHRPAGRRDDACAKQDGFRHCPRENVNRCGCRQGVERFGMFQGFELHSTRTALSRTPDRSHFRSPAFGLSVLQQRKPRW